MSAEPQLRGAKVVAAILEAAAEEISDKGYGGLSIEAVAERAGVNKTTVYRRWPTKAELALEALAQEGDSLFADPATGSLEEDLRVVARRLTRRLRTRRGRALYTVVLENDAGDFKPARSRGDAHAIIERGIARGELPADTDAYFFSAVFFGPVIQQALFASTVPVEAFLTKLVTFALAGARAMAKAQGARGASHIDGPTQKRKP